MKEEEVDKFFKNKFNQYTPAPSADAFARLQSMMEPPRKKQSGMWVYYAAAVVTLTIISGALFFYFTNKTNTTSSNLAHIKPITVPLQVNSGTNTNLADAGTKPLPAMPTVEPQAADKSVKATNNTINATGKPVKKGKRIRPGILVASVKANPYTSNQNHNAARPDNSTNTIAHVTNSPTQAQDLPAVQEKIMEVIIKKDPEVTTVAATNKEYATAEEAIKENVSKKGRLIKNLFKQARNLKNGEKLELSTLGLNANYRIDVESKLFKQKYTKVINL
jgi:hypothetical protein